MSGDELAGRAHLEPGVGVVGVVVLEPGWEQCEDDLGAGERGDLDVVALQGAKASEMPLLCGLFTGVKQGFNPSWRAKTRVSWAV